MTDIAMLTRLIEPEAKRLGLALVRVAMFGGKSDPVLQVMAERPDTRQLDIADCEALSRRISDRLDETDPIDHAYRLEVSSPGIDRPLTRPADFDDWAGHEARIRLTAPIDGRKQFEGVLHGREGDTLRVDVPRLGMVALPLDRVATAKLILTDKLIKATAPISTAGADRISMEG
jgi:ribosome maturation factor RimP